MDLGPGKGASVATHIGSVCLAIELLQTGLALAAEERIVLPCSFAARISFAPCFTIRKMVTVHIVGSVTLTTAVYRCAGALPTFEV